MQPQKTKSELLDDLKRQVERMVKDRQKKLDRALEVTKKLASIYPDGGMSSPESVNDLVTQLRKALS